MGAYGIVRLDLVKGHALSHGFDAVIENGVLAEVNYATDKIVATTDRMKKQVLVASVANLYNSLDESDFRNELSAMKARTYTPEVDDMFSTTQIDYTGDRANFGAVVVGDFAYAAVGGKFTVASTFPATTVPAQKFRVIEKTTLNGVNAIVLRVETA